MHLEQKVEMSTMMLYGVQVRMKARRMALRVCAAFFSLIRTIRLRLVIWIFKFGSSGLVEAEVDEGACGSED